MLAKRTLFGDTIQNMMVITSSNTKYDNAETVVVYVDDWRADRIRWINNAVTAPCA